MKKEDETTPLEPEGEDRDQPWSPESATPPPPPGAESEEADAPDTSAEAAEPVLEPEPPAEPDAKPEPSAPKKKSSVKLFFVLFFVVVFLGLSAAVYFLAKERAETLNAFQEKLAQLDAQLSAIRQGGGAGSPVTAQDLAALRQEFQTFREQTLESLNARQATVEEPSTAEPAEPAAEAHETTAHEAEPDVEPAEPAAEEHETTAHEAEPDVEPAEPATEEHATTAHEAEPDVAHGGPEPVGNGTAARPPQHISSPEHHAAGVEPKTFPGEKIERSREAQEYINLVESTAAQLSRLVRKGLETLRHYLAALLG
ncbi:MAG: hypothetical protein ACE5G9_02935 [Nitrospinales bacterium]